MKLNILKSLLFFIMTLALFCADANAKEVSSEAASPERSISRIRHWSAPTYTRIVIDIGKNSHYSYNLLKKNPDYNKPRRIYVDIDGVKLAPSVNKKIEINDGLLQSIRAGQFKKDVVRVVMDLESIDDYRIFPLTDPFRIVIDIMGERERTAHAQSQDEPEVTTDKKPEPSDPKGALVAKIGDKALKAPLPKGPESSKTVSKPEKKKSKKKYQKATKPAKKKRPVIVIDPGHGGTDPGAIGRRGLMEKDVTLKIAKLLKKKLETETRAKVILTRTRDKYIALDDRTALANSTQCDLFISIHINASLNRKASGVETYFLDVSNDKRSMQLAARENASSLKATSDLQYILADLIRTANRVDSSNLAEDVQTSLVSTLKKKYKGIKGNGVKGAPFYVLVRTDMPSILVEASFISNPTGEKRLKSDKYLRQIVLGISRGVTRFLKSRKAV